MLNVCVLQINVSDMDKARDFYCNKLGFSIEGTYDDGCIVQLTHEGLPLILEEVENPVVNEGTPTLKRGVSYQMSGTS